MSKGKGPTEGSAQSLKELGTRARHKIYISMLMVIAVAVGDGVWNAGTAIAAQSENCALTEPLRIATAPAAAPSSLLLVAQNQDSAAPPDDKVPQSQGEALPSAAQASVAPHPRAASRSEPNKDLSDDLSEYLHKHHLPYVDALVFSSASGRPTLVKLSGQVRTEHGKEDAESKSSDFLNQPGLRMQNHIELDASLASSAPASSSASVIPASSPGSAAGAPMATAPTIATNPCTDLCLKDEGHCNTACQTQAAGGATGGGFSLQALAGQFGQSAAALKQCNDQCVQTREHCSYDCSQAASAGPPPDGVDSGGPQPGNSDHRSEGPDTPPE